jgi:hypothetical protein
MHGVSQSTWVDESETVGRERFESLPEMPRAGATNAWGDLYRQCTACGADAAGRMLDGWMSHGCAWIECASEDAVLRVTRDT